MLAAGRARAVRQPSQGIYHGLRSLFIPCPQIG